MAEQAPEKKIIIDEDWKEEAQREKEMLAQAMEQEKRQKARPPEKASFGLLVTSLATQALISLGEVENPFTKKREVNTKNNLGSDEANLLKNLLFDLRMRFVNKSK